MERKIVMIISFICLLLINGCSAEEKETGPDYEHHLFDTSRVHEIDVTIAEEDWEELLADPAAKKKYSADVNIDGEMIENVSFATKGNSSLMFVAAEEDNDCYPFRINFGKNVKGQTYHGLDKLSLNNLFDDVSAMKDYVSYELFRQTGVKAPLVSFVVLKINGKEHGLYEAVEDVEKGFLERNFQGRGVLYKPESEGLSLTVEDIAAIRNGAPVPAGEAHGADLVYIDEDSGSYKDIFENAQTHAEEEDDRAVIAAMKALAENKDLEVHLDTGEIIDYFAAQVFLLNYDSYIGPMLHNYFLYAADGKIAFLPWDYNLAFGTMTYLFTPEDYADPSRLINTGIDTPLHMADEDKRPGWTWLISDPDYRERYHKACERLLDYLESDDFDKKTDRIHELLRPYIIKDQSGRFSLESYEAGYEALKGYCRLRCQSIRKQLSGDLSSRSSEQDPAEWIDASAIDLLDMNYARD